MTSPIVVYALNIKGKGALQVLRSFIHGACNGGLVLELHISKTGYEALGPKRCEDLKYIIYNNDIFTRVYYQIFFGLLHFRKKIFVFGDIPILFKSQFLLIQNRLYFDPRFKSFKTFLGRVFLKTSMHWVKTIFVQTEAMKSMVRLSYNNKIVVCSHPSGRQQLDRSIVNVSGNDNMIIALTSAYKHKNNELLKKTRLAHDTMLYITLDNAPRYLQENIIYIGSIEEETVSKFYAENPIILVTSYLESYSLPLVEASELGLRFVCPDEDYSEHFQSPNKFVYKQDNAESLNSALAKAMDHNVNRQKIEYHWSTLLEHFWHE